MRRLVWAIVILAVMWVAWWMAASASVQQAMNTWFEDRRELGWTAEVGTISKHGFPLSLHAQLHDVSVRDPGTGVGLDISQLDIMAPAYWPGFLTVKLPDAPFQITTPPGVAEVKLTEARADLRLHPGTSLQLQGISVVSKAWQISLGQSPVLLADTLRLTSTQDNISPETYQLNINAINLTPGNLIRSALALPQDWPMSFDTFIGDIGVTFDKSWDRTAFGTNQPQPRAIALRQIAAKWGSLRISATGDLSINPLGVPTGAVSVIVNNWRDILDLIETSGALQSAQRQQVDILLGAMANLGGDLNDLNLELTFQNGEMSLGPINLGPAPRFVLP
ncbi:MAG: DUF2125 domain-containing protein [Sulfitobacter sp.]